MTRVPGRASRYARRVPHRAVPTRALSGVPPGRSARRRRGAVAAAPRRAPVPTAAPLRGALRQRQSVRSASASPRARRRPRPPEAARRVGGLLQLLAKRFGPSGILDTRRGIGSGAGRLSPRSPRNGSWRLSTAASRPRSARGGDGAGPIQAAATAFGTSVSPFGGRAAPAAAAAARPRRRRQRIVDWAWASAAAAGGASRLQHRLAIEHLAQLGDLGRERPPRGDAKDDRRVDHLDHLPRQPQVVAERATTTANRGRASGFSRHRKRSVVTSSPSSRSDLGLVGVL